MRRVEKYACTARRRIGAVGDDSGRNACCFRKDKEDGQGEKK